MSTATILASPQARISTASSGPQTQTQLLLHEPGQPYELSEGQKIPDMQPGELLVQVHAIGLNPIDWKSAAYGFALPSLPSVNGREFVGKVVDIHDRYLSKFATGDTVLSICTDYRDSRKSAFQEYAVVSEFNAVRMPQGYNAPQAASIGVAFVAAVLALGVCIGLVFPGTSSAPTLNLLEAARSQDENGVPEDVADEVFDAIDPWNRPHSGDWIMIYGASSVTAQVAIQLAKWSGLRVIAIADPEKHGDRLRNLGVDKLIDREDLDKAADQIRSEIPVPIRFALDTVGSETAAWCQNLLASRAGVQFKQSLLQHGKNRHASSTGATLSHLVCLTGSPELRNPNVRVHTVPIKLFHTSQKIGGLIAQWLADLLASGELKLPETVFEDGGLDAVRPCLERVKNGEFSGRRLVVCLTSCS